MQPGWQHASHRRIGCSGRTRRLRGSTFRRRRLRGNPASMPGPDATLPEEFNDIFRQGVLVVGGHAVNLWASYYAHRGDRTLAGFAPFVSKDADIHVRGKDVALAVATAAGWKFRENPEVRRSFD